MNFRKRNKGHVAVEVGALSDILFFLMLFFLMISTLASPTAVKLLLPQAQTGQAIPNHILNLAINANRELYIEKTPTTFEQLPTVLAQFSTQNNNPSVVLRADQTLPISEIVKVVDVVNQQQLPLVLATQKP